MRQQLLRKEGQNRVELMPEKTFRKEMMKTGCVILFICLVKERLGKDR